VSATTRGIFWMSASVLVFILNDALIKLAAETAPALQVIGLRGLFATLWCFLALLATGGWRQMRSIAHPAVFARGLLEGVAALTYLVALSHIPFAVATAVNLSTPFFLTILAVVILKEDVRWRRWTAIVLGFVGVVMVIQPKPDELNVWSWVVVGSSLLGAIRDTLGRYIPAHVPTTIMSFWSAAAVALMGLAFTAFEGWHPMSMRGLSLLIAASLLLAAGYQFLMLALRSSAEMSVLGSLRYGSVLGAIAIGYFVWGDVPNEVALTGIAVIVVSGLYILRRQSARGAGLEREAVPFPRRLDQAP
jgi:drug/metabolite transporter (DMT)-like permease